ncbi:MAG: ABC transporter permease [Clostridia bacterium]|nr:ABC transporter permease [Clostridia bacterium]
MERTVNGNCTYGKMHVENVAAVHRLRFDREWLLRPVTLLFSILYFIVIAIPIYAIFSSAGIKNIFSSLAKTDNMAALRISTQTTLFTVLLIFLICTPVVFYLSTKKENTFSKILEILVCMPTVLPPAVAGIGLLLAFGRTGFIGACLDRLNIEVVFTPAAVVLSQFFVASGFYIQVLKTGMDTIDAEIFEVSYLLGLGKVETFIRVIIPMLAKPLIAGLMLSWTRALGEFGATIMFAGNMSGITRTIPLQIYTLLQTDIMLAASVSILLLVISFLLLFILKIIFRG